MLQPIVHLKLIYFATVLLLAVSTGCHETKNEGATANQAAVRSHQKAEGIELTVEVTPAKLRLSDDLLLKVTLRKQAGVQVHLPGWEDSLAEFIIRDVQTPLPKLDGDMEIIEQSYRLEPTRHGEILIIPPAVKYHRKSLTADTRKADDEPNSENLVDSENLNDSMAEIIEVDPLKIDVTTDLASQSPNLDQLRPENQPLDLPPNRRNLVVWFSLAAFMALLLALVVVALKKRRTQSELQLSPRELARVELQKLIQANWSTLDPKRYFVELTGIVRRFIERTTGVRAPEQTTEEFLRTIAGDRVFADDVQTRLREFLESADLVKFAGLQPSSQEILQSLDRASRFIESELQAGVVVSEAGLAAEQTLP